MYIEVGRKFGVQISFNETLSNLRRYLEGRFKFKVDPESTDVFHKYVDVFTDNDCARFTYSRLDGLAITIGLIQNSDMYTLFVKIGSPNSNHDIDELETKSSELLQEAYSHIIPK